MPDVEATEAAVARPHVWRTLCAGAIGADATASRLRRGSDAGRHRDRAERRRDGVARSLAAPGGGEILGVAGVSGNGQRELADLVLGLLRPIRGVETSLGREATAWSAARDSRTAASRAFPTIRRRWRSSPA